MPSMRDQIMRFLGFEGFHHELASVTREQGKAPSKPEVEATMQRDAGSALLRSNPACLDIEYLPVG